MASGIEDLGNQFCSCSICFEYFKEPKQLPCLHRFCKNCLDKALQSSPKCPLCRTNIKLPQEGADGFQTDFVFKELVKYVEIQKTHASEDVRKCYGCNDLLKAAAFCFQCNDFLCAKCYSLHGTNSTLDDHRLHTLSIKSAESQNITMAKMDSFRDAPRCQSHPSKISELFCQNCNNLPICSSCTEGDHKDHSCLEIETVAEFERGRLTLIMQSVGNMVQRKLAVTPSEVTAKVFRNAENEKENFRQEYDSEVQNVKSELSSAEQRKEEIKAEKSSIKQRAFASFQNDMDKVIQEITNKFEKLKTEKVKEINELFQSREDITEKELNKLYTELERLNKVKYDFENSIEKQLNVQGTRMEEINIKFDKAQKEFDELKIKASSIFASPSKWVATERTPEICKQCDELLDDLLNIPNLEEMSKVKVDDKLLRLLVKKVNTTVLDKELTIPIEAMKGRWTITDITGGDGMMLITGEHALKNQSIIVVFDQFGSMVRQDILRENSMHHSRFCEFLSKFKVASICQPNEIIIYDIRNGSYIKENLSRISSWPSDCDVSCIATNRLNNRVFVGGESSREIYVFDDKLIHQQVLTLPEMFKWPRDMTIHKTYVFICDFDGQLAYQGIIDESKNVRVSELAKPHVDKTQLRPKSVCTDNDGFLYILWISEKRFGRDRYILAQYSRDDRRLIKTKQLDVDARCISVMESDKGEKLLVASSDTVDVHGLCQI